MTTGPTWDAKKTPDRAELYAVCVDRESGKIVHDVKVFDVEKPDFCHPTNSYASCTPALEEGRVYVHFGSYGTACLDGASGKVVWERRDFPCDHFRGPASSPILYKDLLIVNFDGVDVQYVVALNKNTGKTVWKRDRDINWGTDNKDAKKAYGTPSVLKIGGRDVLVDPAAVATIAYDPATGDEVWRVYHGGMNGAARPIYANGLVYICAGGNSDALLALKPEGKGDFTGTKKIIWHTGKSVPLRSSPLVSGNLMFMVADNGVASCLNAKTGEVQWTKRLTGKFWASPILAEGRIYAFNEEGAGYVLAAKPQYKLIAENHLNDGGNASPAVSGKALYVRTATHFYRIEK
jgi:outer membrane protein assembly factor BamB